MRHAREERGNIIVLVVQVEKWPLGPQTERSALYGVKFLSLCQAFQRGHSAV